MTRLYILALILIPFFSFSQGLYNNGANIVVSTNANVVIANGNFVNDNNGQVDLDGKIYVSGDFTNNAANHVFKNVDNDGEVIFNGTTQTINASIANYVDFEKVTINNGSTVTLPAGNGMTTNGTFTVNGTFTSETPNDETIGGSLITKGSVSGSGTINIKRFFKVGNRWQYVGVPMTDQPSSLFTENTPSGNFNPNLYGYDETYDASPDPTNINYSNFQDPTYNFNQAWWNGQVQASAGSPVNLSPAKGYITYNEADITNTFTGTPDKLDNNSSYSPAVTFTANDGNGDYYDGWNLLSNPYPCALDWDDAGWTRTNISGTVYMWDGDNGNYVYYNNGTNDQTQGNGQTLNSDGNARYIPPMQAFFVKVTSTNPSITIPASARVHHSSQMYKNDNATSNPDFDYIKLQVGYQGKTDQLLVRFIDSYDVTKSFDNKYDGYKAFSQTQVLPQIYSLIYNPVETPLAINTLPLPSNTEDTVVHLGIVAKQSGNYTFSVNNLNLQNFNEIYLLDNYNNEQNYVDLSNSSEYTTFIEEGENRDRFSLVFKKSSTPISENIDNKNSDVQIYSYNKQLFVNVSDNQNGQIIVYNTLGQEVFRANTSLGLNEFALSYLSEATYIVKYIANDAIHTKKIVLQ